MKKKNLLKILVLLALVVACKKEKKELNLNEYLIEGEILNSDKESIYIVSYPGPNIDTIDVVNGKFEIKNKLEEPIKELTLKLSLSEDSKLLNLYLEPKHLKLEVNDADISKSVLYGSKTQDEYYALEKVQGKVQEKFKKELNRLEVINMLKYSADFKNLSKDSIKRIEEEVSKLEKELVPFYIESNKEVMGFIRQNPKSYISMLNMLFLVDKFDIKELNQIYQGFDSGYKKTKLGEFLKLKIKNLSKGSVGVKATDFKTVDIDNNPLTLVDFKGKYLLIDFWASWCFPCRKGNPDLLKAYTKYKSEGLEILGVADDDKTTEEWKKAVAKDKIGVWKHVLRGAKTTNSIKENLKSKNDISNSYGVSYLPTKILIDKEGVIIGRYVGGEDDDRMYEDIEKIFNKE